MSYQAAPHASAGAQALRRRFLLTLGAGLAAVIAVWAGVWWYSQDVRSTAVDGARRNTGNLVLAFEQNLLILLDGIDQQTLVIKRQFERDPANFDLNLALRDLPALTVSSLLVAIADKAGNLIAMNSPELMSLVNIADRAHFQVHAKAAGSGIYIGEPVVARVTRKLSIQITRRLDNPDGSFAGVIIVSLDPADISDFFDKIDVGSKGVIAAVGTDGVIRAWASSSPIGPRVGERVIGSPPFMQEPTIGSYISASSFDGEERVVSHRMLQRYPLIVLVGVATSDILAGPIRQMRAAGLIGAVTSGLIVLLCVVHLQSYIRRRRHDEIMRMNAERYQDFARSGSEWQWETDVEGRFTWLSAGVREVIGVHPALMIGHRREEYALDLNDQAWAEYEAAVAARQPFRDLVVERNQATGGLRYIRTSGVPRFDANGAFAGYRGVASDVTLEQEAAIKLDLAQQQLRGIAQNLPGVVYQTWRDAEGGGYRYQFLSGRAEEYFGCSPERAYADPDALFALVHPDDLAHFRPKNFIPPLDRPWGSTYRVMLPSGVRWMRAIARSRRQEDGSIVSDGVAIDVTEIVEREEQLRFARQEAEAANRAKTSFLAHVSHELRTPLNAIMGYAEVIRDSLFGADDRRYPGYAAHIYDSGAHLLAIINDLLDLSRIDSGHVDLEESDVDIASLINDSLALVRSQAANRGILLEQEIAVDGLLRADRRRLSQALINILSNAVKFSSKGDVVRLTVRLETDRRLTIQVGDTGPGISAEDQARIFEPFRRGDATIRDAVEGTGLGLPICKRLMELHGGEIGIVSKLGVGTEVTLTLPRARCRQIRSISTVRAIGAD